MKTIFNAVARELFGPGCRQAGRSLFVCLALFFGLRASGVRVAAAPSVLWLTAGVFTAGAMRQALCSRRSAAIAQGLLILPFSKRAFAAGYPAALAAYTLLTKTAPLLAVLYAVTDWQPADPLPGLLCALHAALLTAAHFPCRRARPLCLLGARPPWRPRCFQDAARGCQPSCWPTACPHSPCCCRPTAAPSARRNGNPGSVPGCAAIRSFCTCAAIWRITKTIW